EALDIFQTLADQYGIAETFDLLGTAACNTAAGPIAAIEYYEQAIALWRVLDERQGLISSLSMLALCGPSYLSATMVWSVRGASACIRDAQEGLGLAQQVGWRSGEAFALFCLADVLGPLGEYTRALEAIQKCLDIATEIEHTPSMTFAY